MTNTNKYPNPIQAQNLEAGDVIRDEEGNWHTVHNYRMIDEKRGRLTTAGGKARIVNHDHVFDLDTGV